MKWKDLKLRTKLALGFGIILILAAVVGLMGIIGTLNLSERTEKYMGVKAIETQIMKARTAEKAYLASPNQQSVIEKKNALEEIYKETKFLKTIFDDDYNIDQMNEIEQAAQIYEKTFAGYITAETEKTELMQKMRESAEIVLAEAEAISEDEKRQLLTANATGAYMQDKIEKAGDAEAIIKLFLLTRKDEKEIIISGDEKYYLSHNENLTKTKALAQDLLNRFILNRNIEQGNRLTAALENYEKNFNSFINKLKSQEEELKTLNENSLTALEVIRDAAEDQTMKLDKEQSNAVIMLIVLVIILILLGIILAYFLSVAFSRPITQAVKFAEAVAEGDYNARLNVYQKDEIGDLADALRNMVGSFKTGVEYAEKIASGDLRNTEQSVSTKQSPLEKALRLMANRLTEVITNIMQVTQHIANGSREISSSASQVAAGANEQAASTEEVSASMEEMAANINQSTDNAKATEEIALKSADGVKQGNNSFKITVEAMREIAGKIQMISEIARKTDVLAINAAIEAARAGEHGKGFAVVANEIRKLAENSQETATVIEDVVNSSVDVAEESDKILTSLLPEVERTSQLVKEITNAGNEQNAGVNQINNAVQELTKVIQQNTSAADEMAAGAKNMALQAEELKSAVTFFKTDISAVNYDRFGSDLNTISSNYQSENNDDNESESIKKTNNNIRLDDYDDSDDDFETYH